MLAVPFTGVIFLSQV